MLRHCLRRVPQLFELSSSSAVFSTVDASILRCYHSDQRFSLVRSYPISRFNREIMASFGVGCQPQKAVAFNLSEINKTDFSYANALEDVEELQFNIKDCMKFTSDILLSQESVNADDLAMVNSAFCDMASLVSPTGRLTLIWPSMLLMILSQYHSHERCLSVAQAVFDYAQQERKAPLLVPYLAYIRLLTKCDGGKHLLKETYEALLKEYDVFNMNASDELIRNLASTDLYKECFIIKAKMEELDSRPAVATYCTLIVELFRHSENDAAFSLLREMAYRNLSPVNTFYEKVFSGDFDPSICYAVIDIMHDLNWLLPSPAAAQNVADWLSRHCCKVCKASTTSDVLTDEEFHLMKKSFMENVMIGDDVFEKSNPVELEAYEKFLHKYGRFDVVIDGLNVQSLPRGDNAKDRNGFQRIELVLHRLFSEHQSADSLRIVIIGRDHVRKRWKPLEQRYPHVAFFYTHNISSDDIFLLYAAMHSGPSTFYLTRDKMRDHRYLMGVMGPVAKIMSRWHRARQMYFVTHGREITLRYPKTHRLQVFRDESSLHIPYEDDCTTITGAVAEKWICAQK